MRYLLSLLLLAVGYGAGLYSPVVKHITEIQDTQEEYKERLNELEERANTAYNDRAEIRYRTEAALRKSFETERRMDQIKVNKAIKVIIDEQ